MSVINNSEVQLFAELLNVLPFNFPSGPHSFLLLIKGICFLIVPEEGHEINENFSTRIKIAYLQLGAELAVSANGDLTERISTAVTAAAAPARFIPPL